MRLFPLLLCTLAYAQEFDVASIKASAPLSGGAVRIGGTSGGPGTNDPTHYTWPSATLLGMLVRAYDVKAYQVSAPDWFSSERFDISVAMPEGTTKDQFAIMWRNLLATRFGVKVHIEKKEFPVDELVVGPRGHKLKETADPNTAPFTIANGTPFSKDGKLTGAGLVTMMRSSPAGITAQVSGVAQPLGPLADMLANQLKHPVVDKTGLSGKYDFVIDYAPTDVRVNGNAPAAAGGTTAAAAADLGLDLVTAVQQQLGLRLERGKGMLDYIVVESAQRAPTEN